MPPAATFVNGDAVRLTQVLSNLINNAAKFSDEGAPIDVVVEVDGAHVAVSVADRGIGIAPDKLDEIFEMFSQLHGSLERSKSGLGLGLPLARRLVELHGGTLVAASAGEGRGSVFTHACRSRRWRRIPARSAPRPCLLHGNLRVADDFPPLGDIARHEIAELLG
jgi:signal transduction histidine kinase